VDAALGPLLDRARASSDRPTLVIVTGDHGEGLGDHGEATHGVFAYEATLRVPLIVAQVGGGRPERGAPGGRCRPSPCSMSISSDRARGARIGPPAGDLGRSLLDPIADADARAAYFEALSPSLNRAGAAARRRRGPREVHRLPVWETYDLARDPGSARTSPTRTRPGGRCSRRGCASSARPIPGAARRGPGDRRPAAIAGLHVGSPPRRRRRTPKTTTRSGWSIWIRRCTAAWCSFRKAARARRSTSTATSSRAGPT